MLAILHSFLLTFFIFMLILWVISTVSMQKNNYGLKRLTTILLFSLITILILFLVIFEIVANEIGISVALAMIVAYGYDYYFFEPKTRASIRSKVVLGLPQGEKVQNDGEKTS